MLIYTYKLEQYVLHKVLPRILLGSRYKIKGSFVRKIPYVTDVDIVNYVNPEINKTNARESIIKLLDSIKDDSQINLLYITCGTDERFKIDSCSDESIAKLKLNLKKEEIDVLDQIIDKYEDDLEKQLFYINEEFRFLYKLRWEPKNIIENKLVRRGNKEITFDSVINSNSFLTLRYFVTIKSIPIGFDVAVYYERVNPFNIYENEAKRTLQISNYKRDYYYMLFPLKYYFRENKKIRDRLEKLIETDFGLHKQIMVRIDTYNLLYVLGKLDIQTATNIVTSIVQCIESYIPQALKFNTIEMIKKSAMNNSPENKMKEWDTELDVLYDEILGLANIGSKKLYDELLGLIPEHDRKKCCI